MIHLADGEKRSWTDILAPYLPSDIERVEIYDRYVRNRFQFRSLDMFVEALGHHATWNGVRIELITTSEKRESVERQLEQLRRKYAPQQVQIQGTIHEPDKTLPHFRRVLVYARAQRLSLWLDRGLDIYKFEDGDRSAFKTLESYIVVEALA